MLASGQEASLILGGLITRGGGVNQFKTNLIGPEPLRSVPLFFAGQEAWFDSGVGAWLITWGNG